MAEATDALAEGNHQDELGDGEVDEEVTESGGEATEEKEFIELTI